MAAKRLRVTHIVHDLDGGGLESVVAAMAERFASTDIEMSVISLSGREGLVGARIRDRLAQYHFIKPARGVSMVWPQSVMTCLRATHAEVVHIHSAWMKAALAAHITQTRRVIYTEHGREHRDPPLARMIDRVAARWTDIVVPVSERLRTYLNAKLGIPFARMRTIENGVDTRRFSPAPPSDALRAQLHLSADTLVVGSVGRLEHVKGYDRLIAAFADVRATWTGPQPLTLVIAGEGSERTALEQQAKDLGVADAVKLPGWLSDPSDAYRLYDVYALTSRSEGMSLSLLEAMASGVSPVVTDVGSNAELLGASLAHQVVRDGTPQAIGAVLRAALATHDARAAAGNTARTRVVERYSLDRVVREYEHLYRHGLDPQPEGR